MKKNTLFFVFLIITTNLIAQLDKKTWLVGGTGSMTTTKSNYRSDTYYQESDELKVNFNPNIGYFIGDKFALGLKQTFSWVKIEVTTDGGLFTNVKDMI